MNTPFARTRHFIRQPGGTGISSGMAGCRHEMPRLTPLASAIAMLALAGGLAGLPVAAAQAGSAGAAWMASGGSQSQLRVARQALVPGGVTSSQQQQQARNTLSRSVNNLNRTANAIAVQQAAQAAARQRAQSNDASVPDGLAGGGLVVDGAPLTAGWTHAKAPVQSRSDGRTEVQIEQTADKAILNWETFNVGKNTTVKFQQDANWAVLNRVNDPQARPSQIQGRIEAPGTVMIVNANGVVFSGTSQVNVRNLVAAAASVTDAQFTANGLYVDTNGSAATFTEALGDIAVQAGARISTQEPATSTADGGYVMLLAANVDNAGEISTSKGQVVMAAGDSFIIRKGRGTEGNASSTTAGNEVTTVRVDGSIAGHVSNTGLIGAASGDITLTGHEIVQAGVAVATTSTSKRGTIHLSSRASDSTGTVTFGAGATTAILVADTDATALDSQRDGMLATLGVVGTNNATGAYDNLSTVTDRADLSRIEVVSGSTVEFQGSSMTLATGGEIVVSAVQRVLVDDGATLDVSGAVGVNVAMASNNIRVNVQGNELRDASVNRDSDAENGRSHISSTDVWIDQRTLVYVPAGTNGYESDRWYTAGGLLEVSGYLANQGHAAGEWLASGGTITVTGGDLVTRSQSSINLSGGTLDVQSGSIRQSWLKGADGRLYEVSSAPADMLYTGLYRGYERSSARWGVADVFYNPLIASSSRMAGGYTVGRDAGKLIVATESAVLDGQLIGEVYQGSRQTEARVSGLDGYQQRQNAQAQGAQLVIGQQQLGYIEAVKGIAQNLQPLMAQVVLRGGASGASATVGLLEPLDEARRGKLVLDSDLLNGFSLGGLTIAASEWIQVDEALDMADGGAVTMYGPQVQVNADITAHGGQIRLGDVLQMRQFLALRDVVLDTPTGLNAQVVVADGVRLDVGGLRSDVRGNAVQAWRNGGSLALRSSGDVLLGEDSVLDVSGGVTRGLSGQLRGGNGGNITLHANEQGSNGGGRLQLDGELRGYGSATAGTLSLRAAQVRIGGQDGGQDDGNGVLHLDENFFSAGFAQYKVRGVGGLVVAEGSQVNVSRQVQWLDSSQPVSVEAQGWLPPLLQENAATGVMTPRGGAGLSLAAGDSVLDQALREQATLVVGQGATISVEPLQTLALSSTAQLTMDGVLKAAGGTVSLLQEQPLAVRDGVTEAPHQRAIRLGSAALIDVSGQAYVAVDAYGQRYGRVDAGGSIIIGGLIDHAAGISDGAYLYVDLAEGSRLRADGARAVLDVPGRGAVEVASNGGSISLASSLGLRMDGGLSAGAGGVGAAGGSLEVALDSGLYLRGEVDDVMMMPRELVLRQGSGQGNGSLDYARGYLDVGQVEAGGFGKLALLSDGSVAFDGSLTLDMAQSLSIYAGSLVLAENSSDAARVTLRAPYVRLAGSNHISTDVAIRPTVKGGLSQQLSQAQLQVEAHLMELRDTLTLGARGSLTLKNGQSLDFDRRGFALTRLRSEGDIRFLGSVTAGNTVLEGNADLELLGAQLYPVTGAIARVITSDDALLRIGRVGTIAPAAPHSVFGNLSFVAGTVEQGGVVRAPLGGISLGNDSDAVHKVRLLPGSITSISANGLLMPYGGTVDGLSYLYDGQAVTLNGAASGLGLTLAGQSIEVQEGALIDLSGGGELTGAGFVSGRGGSTDARYYPLVQQDSDGQLLLPSLASNPVYAIVPGLAVDYAPLAGEAGVANPAVGQQITIDHDVPGLSAGTYTLLPASYALLPGAFRVELNGLAGAVRRDASLAMRNGSWAISGRLSVANTSISQALPGQFIVTSGDVLRRYSQYNEMSYADFVRADAATKGVPRAALEADGQWLKLILRSNINADETFSFAGTADFSAAEGGRWGGASLQGPLAGIEIVRDGQASQLEGVESVVSVRDSQLNALGAPSLVVGGYYDVVYGQGGNQLTFKGYNRNVWLRAGASLRGAELMLLSNTPTGGVNLEQGASIITLGHGEVPFDANDGFVVTPGARALLAVSNGRLDVLPPDAGSGFDAPGKILIGECGASPCGGQTQLYTEGSIVAATNNTFSLDDTVSFGARYLGLSVGRINVGSSETLASAAAAGVLGQGLTFNQQVMNRLFQGEAGSGIPALETLTLAAAGSLNFYGDVVLDTYDAETGKNRLEQLVLGVSAIYGLGKANDRATIRTGELVWNGAAQLPGVPIDQGAGSGDGVLAFQVESMVFGYGAVAQPDSTSSMARQALGFKQVSINASRQVSANHQGSLEVYHRRGDYQADGTLAYTGGDLVVDTPLWTGSAGSINHIKAGGELRFTGGGGQLASGREGVGAELALSGQRLDIQGTFSLPSGKLSLEAVDELLLGEGSLIDLAGRTLAFNDVLKYSAGGTLSLSSQAGSILQAAGASIDLSASNNRAGRLDAAALGEQAGRVELLGTILGSASGQYDAGGTMVSYAKGVVDIRARQLDDFAALNERLNRDDMTGGRSFQLRQGNLVVGNELKANEVSISLDNGHLTINGVIDASGEQVGSIRLAARNGLTIASGARLDAHGSQLRVDSYGAIIDAPNRAVIDLDGGAGQLTLQAGASFDLRHGTDAIVGSGAGQHDGRNRGTLQLTAMRLGGEIAGDIAIDASGALDIRGARSIAVVGSQRYGDANDGGKAANGRDYQYIDQAYLDAKHVLNQRFMSALLDNADLLDNRLKGLRDASYVDALHLRPGIEVTTAEGVDLVVRGDLDLSGHRYESLNLKTPLLQGVTGSGEVGNLSLRAGGNLEVYGSISDGFSEPDFATNSDRWDGRGWILVPGKQPFDGVMVIPRSGVELAAGTLFPAGSTLNFDLPFSATTLAANTRLPGEMVLSVALTLPADTVLDAAILDGAGNVLHAAGTLLGSPVSLPAGTRLAAGSRLPVSVAVRDGVWASGTALPSEGLSQRGTLSLASGAVLPVGVDIKLAEGTPYIDLRPEVNGQQGRNWALARMLPEGSQSWSMRLVAGADLEAADSRITSLDTTAGMLRLADQHYTAIRLMETVPAVTKYVWSDAVTGSRVPGAVVPDNQAALCRTRPAWCIITEQIPSSTKFALNPLTQLFSVLRTGTGDLELLSAGDWRMDSLYGVYTAGTQSAAVMADGVDPYQLAQGRQPDGTVLGGAGSFYESATGGYLAWYPEHGGNLLLTAGGNLTGNQVGAHDNALTTRMQQSSAAVGNWLWRQGGEQTPAAWWLNFGSYALDPAIGSSEPWLVGFTGIGTLGGGNLDVFVKGAAGLIETAASNLQPIRVQRSHGLGLAIGSTGRVLADGSLLQTGGGDLDLRVGGGINTSLEAVNAASLNADLRGTLVNLRGALQVEAASIGMLDLTYGSYASYQSEAESRAYDPYVATRGAALGGLTLMPGDGVVRLTTRGDMVVQGVGDPGRVPMFNTTAFTGTDGVDYLGNGWNWFSLWRANTAVDLLSLGGHLTPIAGSHINPGKNLPAMGGRLFYPTALRAVAANGSLYYGEAAKGVSQDASAYSLMTAPSANTELQLLAGQSIYGGSYTVSQTGTDASAIATPQHPAYLNYSPDYRERGNNLHADLPRTQRATPLFSFAVNSYIAGAVQPAQPVRFYALEGDIVGLNTGEIVRYPNGSITLYQGAGPVWIMAGRDVVNAGTPLGSVRYGVSEMVNDRFGNGIFSQPNGNLFIHGNSNDVSIVSAGRDIRLSTFNVAGPGLLEVVAGRNVMVSGQGVGSRYQEGAIRSIGRVGGGGSGNDGASISVVAGAGTAGPDYGGLLSRYLDSSRLLAAGDALDANPNKVVKVYDDALQDWLVERFGFEGDTAAALAFFDSLPGEQQRIFARQIYFAELRAGGREYNDASSPRQGSYLRGRQVIAALFPAQDEAGNAISYGGNAIFYGGAGIHTDFGGSIQVLTPGGDQVFGVAGEAPPATAGVITRGSGDIQLYSRGSILLGQSRIMTTFGGAILGWSAQGDINAGRGSRTTVVYTPPRRAYDSVGNVAIAPDVPASGAGIATLAPIPEVPAGDVDLIAPLGTVDAGEAGIRVSGNVNVAALRVVNADNIQVQGDSAGVPVAAAVNVGALSSASAASSSAAATAQEAVARSRAAARQNLPSIINVQILGFGGDLPGESGAPAAASAPGRAAVPGYDTESAVQVLGAGRLDAQAAQALTPQERRALRM